MTLVSVFHVKPGNQGALVSLLAEAAERAESCDPILCDVVSFHEE